MTTFGLKPAAFKASFFDRAAVIARVDRGKSKAMARSGALVRTIARRSIRKRKGTSLPGQAPSSHKESGHRLRDRIFFAHDATSGGVVIGPEATKHYQNKAGTLQAGLATETLEYGGSIGIVEKDFYGDGKWVAVNHRRRRRTGERRRVRWVRIKPRPYMGPALNKAAPQIATFWKNSIKG